MIEYRIIDLQVETTGPDEIVVSASSPERAVRDALGVEVVRGGSKRDLRARVYSSVGASPFRW
jgi:hypothetical protein